MRGVNSDIAYNYIRKRILSGDYAPGRALMTKNLAEEIGVSRTPVRDALRQLEGDGLVSIRPRLGASVKQADLKEFREMCGLRLALEGFAAGLAATHWTQEDLHEIRIALEAMAELTARLEQTVEDEAPLHAELVREDIRFHVAIMTAAKNSLMKREILRLHLINRVVSGPQAATALDDPQSRKERRASVLASHRQIFRAIEQRDAAAAQQAMETHIRDIIDLSFRRFARAETGPITKHLTEEELSYLA